MTEDRSEGKGNLTSKKFFVDPQKDTTVKVMSPYSKMVDRVFEQLKKDPDLDVESTSAKMVDEDQAGHTRYFQYFKVEPRSDS